MKYKYYHVEVSYREFGRDHWELRTGFKNMEEAIAYAQSLPSKSRIKCITSEKVWESYKK